MVCSTPWLVSRPLRELGVRLPARPERLAQQRRRAAEERIAARVMELGFADVRAYLVNRVVGRGWLVVDVVAELRAAPGTVRRLLQCHRVRRVRCTAGERAALARGRRVRRAWRRGWRCLGLRTWSDGGLP